MAGFKRKADKQGTEPSSRKRRDSGQGGSDAKRRRRDSATEDRKQNIAESGAGTLSTKSLLDDDERAFPRGGGGVLTPFETKQIKVQAAKDVLFEESNGKSRADPVASDDEGNKASRTSTKASAKSKKGKMKRSQPQQEKVESRVKVQGLKFKQLSTGALLLGRISQISDNHLVLDLPNNLTGTVSITAISTAVTTRAEAEAQNDEDDTDMTSEADHDSHFSLQSVFYIGQYLRASVLSTMDVAAGKEAGANKKKIQLTIDPKQTNGNIESSNLAINSMIQASVASIEDHGVVLDLGLQDKSVRGFMPSKELHERHKMSTLQEGTVLLCLVTNLSSNGKVVKLSARQTIADQLGSVKILRDAPTVDTLIPGTAVEVLVSQISKTNLAGKIMGLLTATTDIVHSGASMEIDLESKFPIGSRVNARIIFKLNDAEEEIVGVSLLDHLVRLITPQDDSLRPVNMLPPSSFIDESKVTHVEPGLGLFLDVGIEDTLGFVHSSKMADGKAIDLADNQNRYKSGTVHRGRVLGYNSLDGLFLVSLQKSVLEQAFLRLEDVKVGQTLKAKVEKIVVNASGLGGVLLKISDGINGLVPENHMADIHLQHPERKFKEGVTVTARVLSVNLIKRKLHLTLKKSLVNTDSTIWDDYNKIEAGSWSPGTVVKLNPQGAVLQFFGNVRGFLPIVEMSSDYVKTPADLFRVGQTLSVRAKNVVPRESRLILSCRADSEDSIEDIEAYGKLKAGDIVSGTINAKSLQDVTVELDGSNLKASLRSGHLTDRTAEKNASVLKAMQIGQSLKDLLVVELFPQKMSILLSKKPSLVQDAKLGRLVARFQDIKEQDVLRGFVRNIVSDAVYVQFCAGLVGLLPKSHISEEFANLPSFGMQNDQSLTARVLALDPSQERFLLSMKEPSHDDPTKKVSRPVETGAETGTTVNPVDEESIYSTDFVLGKITKARVTSVKQTQLNVALADNVQGRIDISEVFTEWQEIKDRKHPLRAFKSRQIIPVRILGIHDAKSHSFLPITHRGRKFPVFELSAKLDDGSSVTTMDQLQLDTWYTAFVNNVTKSCVWVNVSPNVRGRLGRLESSDDVSVVNDLETNFPPGSAIRVRVKHMDVTKGHLDLSAKKSSSSDEGLTIDRANPGMVIVGRVLKTSERSVLVKLSDALNGAVPLTELADDYSLANPTTYQQHDIIRASILEVDSSNKKIILSTRPSKVLSSSSKVKDPSITKLEQLKVNDIVRGFVKNVADVGLFINLGYKVTGFVRVTDLSDDYIKDWKASFEIDKLVTGKVIFVDSSSGHVQLSLKSSVVSKDYVPLTTFNDLSVGQVVTGKIRKVEDFGAFIVVDNSRNVSGLCHRSEVAERRVSDVRDLYTEGDAVKAVVLSIEPEKRRISFGLKQSYFENVSDSDDDNDGIESPGNSFSDEDSDDKMDVDGGIAIDQALEGLSDAEQESGSELEEAALDEDEGLQTSGFDFSGGLGRARSASKSPSDSESDDSSIKKKKKRRKPAVQTDATADLDTYGPNTSSDFERLLLSQKDSSELWIRYMTFHIELSQLDEARAIAQRALRDIDVREQEEKMNIWVALLNLENAYGTPETLEEIFQRACRYADPRELHERLISIYIASGKLTEADDVFQGFTRLKDATADPKLWENYASFLFDSLGKPDRARGLLDRAMQSVPDRLKRDLVTKFARLEFKCRNGDAERGRTMFEGLFSSATGKKRWDLWDMLVDLEKGKGETDNVRSLYERMSGMKMKSSRGKLMFKRWRDFEEAHGKQNSVAHVLSKAEEFVKKKKEEQAKDGESE